MHGREKAAFRMLVTVRERLRAQDKTDAEIIEKLLERKFRKCECNTYTLLAHRYTYTHSCVYAQTRVSAHARERTQVLALVNTHNQSCALVVKLRPDSFQLCDVEKI